MTASNTLANTLLQRTVGPDLRSQTASLYMLAVRGGRSVGDLATGVSIHVLGVRHALLVNGALAIVLQLAVGRMWTARPIPVEAESRE